ncbi:hypothetical protein [Paenibacillus sp.]|jgi:hypothetical protein|nr:hypothetical protein [Paenibacillus sp.]MDR0270847.1 hypothetical protein [Paenibacillus sp.]
MKQNQDDALRKAQLLMGKEVLGEVSMLPEFLHMKDKQNNSQEKNDIPIH